MCEYIGDIMMISIYDHAEDDLKGITPRVFVASPVVLSLFKEFRGI